MTLEQHVLHYYPSSVDGIHYNCAEAMLLAMNDAYNLNLKKMQKFK